MSQLRHFKQKTGFSYDPNKVLVVSTTTKARYDQTLLYESLKDQSYTGSFIIHENNKKGLCEIYNQYITDKWDCVIFVHDDVYIDSCNFVEKIYDGFRDNEFDVCGLAGGSNLKIKKPLLWHLITARESQSGVVSHGTKKRFIPSVFGNIGKQTVLLDGLFLAIQPRSLIEKNIKFDENIKGFHHYDLKFSVDCFQAGLILGTLPIHVIHSSPGLNGFSKEYLESEDYFYNELKNYARE
jgi:hypothetical protein